MSREFNTIAILGRHEDPRVAEPVAVLASYLTKAGIDVVAVANAAADLPVRGVLLTSDLEPEELLAAADRTGVEAVQPYGGHSGAAARAAVRAGLMVLRPIRLGHPEGEPDRIVGTVPLFDTHRPGAYGGTGDSFDWRLLDGRRGEYIVAGGLGPDNVGELIRLIRPWGVDASSRLESAPGVKDLGKVAAFVEEAKRA